MNKELKALIGEIDDEIRKLSFGTEPCNLYQPIKYILGLGGKRIRPLLTVLAYRLYRDDHKKILYPALAVEVFHNFTLLHDDIMDKAPLRRGQATVHKRWNDNIAILSGDVMLVRVYDLLLKVENSRVKEVISTFNDCAAKVCEGQQLDMDFETLDSISEEDYIHMIENKTAVLLGYSLKLGGLLAEVDGADLNWLFDYGVNIGTGFQLMDDLLDVYADSEKFGKQVGGDILTNKKTYLLIKALELAKGHEREELITWIRKKEFNDSEKIEAVKKIYDSVGIRERVTERMNGFLSAGYECLSKISIPENKKENLKILTAYLINRDK